MTRRALMVGGDVATIGVITIAGFATHDVIRATFIYRMAVFFVVFAVSWIAVSWALGAMSDSAAQGRFTWRVPLSMLVAAPVATFLRALILWVPVEPVFVAVITGVATAGISIWRLAWRMVPATPEETRS